MIPSVFLLMIISISYGQIINTGSNCGSIIHQNFNTCISAVTRKEIKIQSIDLLTADCRSEPKCSVEICPSDIEEVRKPFLRTTCAPSGFMKVVVFDIHGKEEYCLIPKQCECKCFFVPFINN